MLDDGQKSTPRIIRILIFMFSIIIGILTANLTIRGFGGESLSGFFTFSNLIAVIIVSFLSSFLIVIFTEKMQKRKKT